MARKINSLSNDARGAHQSQSALHDLRRIGAIMMQQLGVGLYIIDRCQNHVLPGNKVRRHYMHPDYADEKRAAWGKLGGKLTKTFDIDLK